MYKSALRNALHNLRVTDNQDYNHGLVIGIVSALMLRMSFETAIAKIAAALPRPFIMQSNLPDVCRDDIMQAYNKLF